MKDAYSFDRDYAGIDTFYPKIYQAYFDIFRRCGIDVIAVESDTGMMGGTMAHEFMALTAIGEDTLLLCDSCGYKANRQIATFQKTGAAAGEAQPLEEVYTPAVTTIAALADFLQIPETMTAKAIFLMAEMQGEEGQLYEQFVFVVIRGDMELNETKLTNAIKARRLRPATVDEIRAIGAEPGYGSPIGIQREKVLLLVDDLVVQSPNLVAGANRKDWHYRHVNYGRDYTADLVTDLVAAGEGRPVLSVAAMQAVRGVEVGNLFKLGAKQQSHGRLLFG
ncbi:MAG: YbaK/EbsC family protein [Caldilineaceae bacterium]